MLKKTLVLDYKLVLASGLHIGGGNDQFDIGGADSTVIKNPLTNEPYIPGSSLKGKLRQLLTLKYGELDGTKFKLPDPVLRSIFEPVGEEDARKGELQCSRAIFRDARLTKESAEKLQKYLGIEVFTELKAENSIDPLKSKAANPRFIERVPAGAEFTGQIVLQVFEGDNEKNMINYLLEAFRMLEMSYLGGSGTRGYGRIEIPDALEFKEV